MKKIIFTCFILIVNTTNIWSQDALIQGQIKDVFGEPISNVSVLFEKQGTVTDSLGHYKLNVTANKKIILLFKHISYLKSSRQLLLKTDEIRTLNITLQSNINSIDEVKIKSHKNEAEGITEVKVETVQNLSSTNPGIESTLKIIGLGTSSDNELSTQYKVRGGNYDENLVYVNGIEVYRPFLVRSGQQEGLSFVNVNLTQNVKFSSGGFQAKYGDKLSSVLDITYRKPTSFGVKTNWSLLGAELSIEGITPNKKSTAIVGVRYRNNSMLVKNKDINTNYKPRFLDIQSYITHQVSKKFSIDFLGTFSINDYNYIPKSRETKFGTIQEPLEIIVNYNGLENDQYITSFGALSFKYKMNNSWDLTMISSLFNTQEEEYFDIEAFYALGNPDSDASSDDYGDSEYTEGIGSQLNHARNALDALISNVQLKTKYHDEKNQITLGIKYQLEDIRDRLVEWEMIDSSGFSIRPPGHIPNEQPYEPYEGPIVPYQDIRAENNTDLQRITAFTQWNRKMTFNEYQLWTSIGLRTHYWEIDGNEQIVFSPRFQIALKPDWERDVLFRISGGSYTQPPFYKELRDADGIVQSDVKAQKSIHLVLGGDFSFKLWNRPFKLVSEAYYKSLSDVNPYTLDNVRIRYAANNNAVAFATGLDFRLNGEFVPGTESWFSFGYLNTQENIDNQGYIPRPSDQRLKFSLLFQDYAPNMPHLKMYMNLVYNTGVPGGSPTYANPYDYQYRLGDYKRADLGVFYVFKDPNNHSNVPWLASFKEFSVGFEIFNMFDIQNAITNTWVRDIYSKRMYSVKNYMTGRIFNIKLKMEI